MNPIQQADEIVRYCPECGSIGPAPEGAKACCPDSFGMSLRRWQAEKMERMLDRLRTAIAAALGREAAQPDPLEKLTRLSEDMGLYDDQLPEATQPTQAEAPSERLEKELRELQEVADKLREAGYHSAANSTERTIADIKSKTIPRAVIGAALATQQAGQGEALGANEENPVVLWAEIWRLRAAVQGPNGFASWQDAAVHERVLRVKAERALATQRVGQGEAVVWLRELLRRARPYVLEASTRYYDGTDGASTRQNAHGLRVKIDEVLAATPPATGQVERDREDAKDYRWLIDGKRGTRVYNHVLESEQREGYRRVEDAIRAARSSEGGV